MCVYQSMFILHLIMLCPPWSMLSMIQLWWWYNAKLLSYLIGPYISGPQYLLSTYKTANSKKAS